MRREKVVLIGCSEDISANNPISRAEVARRESPKRLLVEGRHIDSTRDEDVTGQVVFGLALLCDSLEGPLNSIEDSLQNTCTLQKHECINKLFEPIVIIKSWKIFARARICSPGGDTPEGRNEGQDLPGPSSTERGLWVLSTGSPTVRPAKKQREISELGRVLTCVLVALD